MPRGRPVKCPYCAGSRTIRKGHRRTATLGPRPLRQCKDCGRRFTHAKPTPKPGQDAIAAA